MSVRQLFDNIRADDFVEYLLFPNLEITNGIKNDTNNLDEYLKTINLSVKEFVGDYIWHKEPFQLYVHDSSTKLLDVQDDNKEKDELPPCLHGLTFFGENIQDEWFIVEILFHLTRIHPGLVARVFDSDGEFLLIEAADYLPEWANPDTCSKRVYIHSGYLHIVQNSPSNTSTSISTLSAVSKIRQNPKLYKASESITNCVKARLTESKKERQFHHITVYLPLSAAVLLKNNPFLISSVVRAFCERDTIDLKSCRAMKHFPPETRVYSEVRFTRCLYAMITCSKYNPDRITGWQLPGKHDPTFKAHEIGMKIACGFEILASKASPNGDLSDDRDWQLFLKQLKSKEYFGENIEHSKEYTRKMQNAQEYYKMFVEKRPISSLKAAKHIVDSLKDLNIDGFHIEKMQQYTPNDDNEDWLNISAEDLDKLLMERYGIKKANTSDTDNVQDAKDLTESLNTFLNEKSEFDGIDIRPVLSKLESKTVTERKAQNQESVKSNIRGATASKTDEDNQPINFNPDAFQAHLKEMLDFVLPEENWESQSDMSDFDDEIIGNRIDEMIPGQTENKDNFDFATYMKQMEAELSSTTISKSFRDNTEDDFDDIESFEPVNIDVESIKNLRKSYQSQLGGHGPTSSLFGNLGIRLDPEIKDENIHKANASFNTDV